MKTLIKISLVVSALMVAAPATAASASATAGQHQTVDEAAAAMFAQLDVNKDGYIDRTEVPRGHPLRAHFAMSDANRDGKLSRREFASAFAML
jgi:Ca2+-binding EF-hand superfamily protein